jgi:two-component system LytT family response regulator
MTRAVIVENEAAARNTLLKLLASYSPEILVAGTAATVREARTIIQDQKPDLVFLDIELNDENSFELFNFFPAGSFDVIFTTAHREYALQAIKLSCLDYLLKPIDYQELQSAIQKRKPEYKERIDNLIHNLRSPDNSRTAIPSAGGYEFVATEDIIMAMAEGNYTRIYTAAKEILCTQTLGEMEKHISLPYFFRSHKSFLVNLHHVERFTKTDNLLELSNGLTADLAIRKREEFINIIVKKKPG